MSFGFFLACYKKYCTVPSLAWRLAGRMRGQMPLPEAPAGRPRVLLHRPLQARVRQGREDLRQLLQRRVRQAAGGCTEGNNFTIFFRLLIWVGVGRWHARESVPAEVAEEAGASAPRSSAPCAGGTGRLTATLARPGAPGRG